MLLNIQYYSLQQLFDCAFATFTLYLDRIIANLKPKKIFWSNGITSGNIGKFSWSIYMMHSVYVRVRERVCVFSSLSTVTILSPKPKQICMTL